MDRTKEPGSIGEPLFLDVVAALAGKDIRVIGGRYGLASKEFTPSMVLAIYKHSEKNGFHGFTVGINDDVLINHYRLKNTLLQNLPELQIVCSGAWVQTVLLVLTKTQLRLSVNIQTKMLRHTLLMTQRNLSVLQFLT
jgi:hypothetical protein